MSDVTLRSELGRNFGAPVSVGSGSAAGLASELESVLRGDARYAIDASKIERELGWKPSLGFDQGIRQTVEWYIGREDWWRPILDGRYQGDRLGLKS